MAQLMYFSVVFQSMGFPFLSCFPCNRGGVSSCSYFTDFILPCAGVELVALPVYLVQLIWKFDLTEVQLCTRIVDMWGFILLPEGTQCPVSLACGDNNHY